jgi:uncharacterized membrane protein
MRYDVAMEICPSADTPVLFEAMIVPHRSLSPSGLRVLIAVIAASSALTMLRFLLLHAWPVVAFSVVEVAFAILLLRLNARRARQSELVLLTESGLRLIRTDASGRKQSESLPHSWLNVVLEDVPGRVPRLLLVARELRREIGATLGEAEKRDLALALNAALYRIRNKIFDNPQLRG